MNLEANKPTGRAHGKCILIGEHSVVHGTPAIALPAGLFVEVELGDVAAAGLSPEFSSWFSALAQKHVDYPWVPARIAGDLPQGSGLGSSAALSVAALRALDQLKPIAAANLLTWADEAERIFHGNPSGVDVRAVLADTPIRYRRTETGPHIDALAKPPGAWHFQLWITPAGDSTATVVARVSDSLARTDKISELRLAADSIAAAEAALMSGNAAALGAKMFDFHRWLARHGASTTLLDQLVDQARQGGALGAKLTGGGGGGAMIVLAPDADWQPPTLPSQVDIRRFSL